VKLARARVEIPRVFIALTRASVVFALVFCELLMGNLLAPAVLKLKEFFPPFL
jgi:hypothetical protein